MDSETLRKVTNLSQSRAQPPRQHGYRDGMARLGAQRALDQLATDLEIMADHCGPEGQGED